MGAIAPKRRISKQRKHKRRSSVWKLDMPGMVKCSHCGYYDGKQVLKLADAAKNA